MISKASRYILPDGEPVRIEKTYPDGYAQVRRLTGELRGTLAVCAIAKLEPDEPSERGNVLI